MKATLSFDLDNFDQKLQYRQCVKAKDMAIALFEILSNVRKNTEWTIESWEEADQNGAYRALEDVMSRICDIVDSQGINIDELID